MLTYVRIAVTALSITACLLLIALWVRAYSTCDRMSGIVMKGHAMDICTWYDFVAITITDDTYAKPWAWHSFQYPNTYRKRGILCWFHLPDEAMPYLVIPHWFLVLLAGTFVALPWIRWRFSLRTLLIATTLVAMGTGIVVAAR